MTIFKNFALTKLNDFLDGKIPQETIYEWALAVVVSREYEQLVKTDPILKAVIQALIDMNHKDAGRVPSRADLEYLKKCLEGQAEFEPLAQRWEKARKEEKENKSKSQGSLFLALRIYVVLFALCSIAVNILAVLKPNLFQWELENPSALNVLLQVWPHLLYAIFLLIPFKKLVRGLLYYCSIGVLGSGSFYYGYITVDIVIKLSLNILMIFVVAPFSVIPAVVALFLLIHERRQL